MPNTLNKLTIPDYKNLISQEMKESIKNIKYFRESQYSKLIIPETLEFYTKRFVQQLPDFAHIDENTIIVDVGAGFGWLSMAFAYSTKAQLVAIEVDKKRLEAGKEIAHILGVEHRIDWRYGSLGELPLKDKEANIVYCIEVLEHTNRNIEALRDLCRVSNELIIITTPNLWFPVIAHDTELPFCHWLPISIRKVYAKLFKKTHKENDNLFWSPYTIQKHMTGFKPVSKWLHYSSIKRFKETFPFYLPYGEGRYVQHLGKKKAFYYEIASKLGIYSHYILPSLSYVLKKV